MSGRLINIERRACGDNLTNVTGYLMANGAFVFQKPGVSGWWILTHAQLGGFRGTAGDPHIVPYATGAKVRMSYFKDEQNFFYTGDLKRKLGKGYDEILRGSHPQPPPATKVYEHFSDNLKATGNLNSGLVSGGINMGWTIDIPLGGLNSIMPRFEWDAVNPGSGIDGEPVNALDTYFAGVIGLGTCILIGQRLEGQLEAVVANIWNGAQLVPVGQPSEQFFTQAFSNIGETFQWTAYQLYRAKPLCRVPNSDAALCVGEATIRNLSRMTFPAFNNRPWWMYYMETVSGTLGAGAVTTSPLVTAIGDSAFIDKTRPHKTIDITLDGSASLLFHLGPNGYSAPLTTGWNGQPLVGAIRHGGSLAMTQPGLNEGRYRLLRRYDGAYELWESGDPDLPGDSEFGPGNTYILGQGRTVRTRTFPNLDAPYPTSGQMYRTGYYPRAATPHNLTYFVHGIDAASSEGPVMGMLDNVQPSPFSVNVSTPRSAGPFLFLSGWRSADNGATWQNHSAAYDFGELTYSAGNTTVAWRFGLTKQMLDQSVPV